jgi:hypothetical protein
VGAFKGKGQVKVAKGDVVSWRQWEGEQALCRCAQGNLEENLEDDAGTLEAIAGEGVFTRQGLRASTD